jgi:hypothetical protein
MCEPASIAYGIAAIAGGLIISKSMKATQQAFQSAPEAAAPPPPTPIKEAPVPKTAQPVQQAKAPNVQALRAANTGATPGRGTNATATMLTGAGGVDLTSLDIGRNTLLGGGG